MFNQLTEVHCLYHIKQDSLNTFLELATKFTFKEDVSQPLSLNSVDNCAVVLQIWCMLHEDDYHFVFDTDKMMAYACNYYCLNLLRNDKNIHSFLKGRRVEPKVKFILAYYLAYVTLQWVHELMLENEAGPVLIDINMTRNYFLFSTEEQLLHDEQHHFYKTQRYITQLLAADFITSPRYTNYIQHALTSTKNYLNQL